MCALISALASIGLMLLDRMTGTHDSVCCWGLPSELYALAVLLPSLPVSVHRLHDRDKSGWWMLLALTPLIGAIIVLVWFVMDGDRGENHFGSDPNAGEAEQLAVA